MLDRIIFGDNQFFGINHMSEDKAQALSEKFKNLKAITDVLRIAYDCGIRGFMLNTNDRAKEICDYFLYHSSDFPDLRLYPSLPYAHKYATAVGEKGIFGAIKDTLISNSTAVDILGIISKSGLSLFEKDMIKVMQILIDVEMKIFKGLNVKVIFLQNIMTDLLLGIGVRDVFVEFTNYIKKRYDAEPGFVTMNMPKLVDFLLSCGIENPIICSSINKAGYFMNPDMESYEKCIENKQFRPIAMSILASGAVKPKDAVEYICKQQSIKSIVFGASSKQHILETKSTIEQFDKKNIN